MDYEHCFHSILDSTTTYINKNPKEFCFLLSLIFPIFFVFLAFTSQDDSDLSCDYIPKSAVSCLFLDYGSSLRIISAPAQFYTSAQPHSSAGPFQSFIPASAQLLASAQPLSFFQEVSAQFLTSAQPLASAQSLVFSRDFFFTQPFFKRNTLASAQFHTLDQPSPSFGFF